jgi:hypothetical protein
MNTEAKIRKLLRAKTRIERRLDELDKKLEHMLFRMHHESRCRATCPLEDEEDKITEFWK